MAQISRPETSLRNFHSTLRNIHEEHRSKMLPLLRNAQLSVGPTETHVQWVLWVLLWGYSDQVVKLNIYVQLVSMLTMGAAILDAYTPSRWEKGRIYLYPSVNYDLRPQAQAKVRVQTCRSFQNPVLYQLAARVTVLNLTHCLLTFKARLTESSLVVPRCCGVCDDEELRVSTARCRILQKKIVR